MLPWRSEAKLLYLWRDPFSCTAQTSRPFTVAVIIEMMSKTKIIKCFEGYAYRYVGNERLVARGNVMVEHQCINRDIFDDSLVIIRFHALYATIIIHTLIDYRLTTTVNSIIYLSTSFNCISGKLLSALLRK